MNHRFSGAPGKARQALLGKELQDGVQEFRIGLAGHYGFGGLVFGDTPTGNHDHPPSTSFSRAERLHPSGVRLRSARYTRLRSASPRKGAGGGKKDKLQKHFYTGSVDGIPRRATMELSGANHQSAIRSYKEQIPIVCIGTLAREGRSWILKNPREVRLLEEVV